MIIKVNNLPEVSRPANALVLKEVVNREKHGDGISVTWVKLQGHHKKLVCDVSDRVYYIIEGDGKFQIGDDAAWGNVTTGDVVFLAKGVPYVFEGEMTYLVMNGPAFLPGSDRFLE